GCCGKSGPQTTQATPHAEVASHPAREQAPEQHLALEVVHIQALDSEPVARDIRKTQLSRTGEGEVARRELADVLVVGAIWIGQGVHPPTNRVLDPALGIGQFWLNQVPRDLAQ